jgi:hypothetical protein
MVTRRIIKMPSEFGMNLFRARTWLSWTRLELRDQTKRFVANGVSENTIYNIEVGNSPGKLEIQLPLKKAITEAIKRPYPWKEDGNALNNTSLTEFINNSLLVSDIDQDIAAAFKVKLIPPASFIEIYSERISHVGIRTISDIEHHLKERKQTIKKFAAACKKHRILDQPYLPHGICFAVLQVLLLLENGNVKGLKDYLAENRLSKNSSPHKMTHALKLAYKETRG